MQAAGSLPCRSVPTQQTPRLRQGLGARSVTASSSKDATATQYGVFVSSGSPAVAEVLANSGLDWICVDTQHAPVGPEALAHLLRATRGVKTIVRVGGPDDRYGIQQALE